MRITYVKQRIAGLLLLILPLLFVGVLIEYDAAIALVLTVPTGLYYLLSNERLFNSDYIFELRIGRRRKGL